LLTAVVIASAIWLFDRSEWIGRKNPAIGGESFALGNEMRKIQQDWAGPCGLIPF
jgi:hypothetical protein